jgi:hypothetical protein
MVALLTINEREVRVPRSLEWKRINHNVTLPF